MFHIFCRWGVGHSTGLVFVGGIFIVKDFLKSKNGDSTGSAEDVIDIPDRVGHFFESLVGLFMIALGVYGLRSAFRKQRELQGGIILVSSEDEDFETEAAITQAVDGTVSITSRFSDEGSTADRNTVDEQGNNSQNAVDVNEYSHYQDNVMGDHQLQTQQIRGWTRLISTKLLAFLAGIVHGLAGPGGVLGIVPAVQLHNWKLASCYLGSFCISSTLTMGLFACSYGTISSFVGVQKNWEFQVQCFSAFLSFAVGITWLVLLSMGKLEDVFP